MIFSYRIFGINFQKFSATAIKKSLRLFLLLAAGAFFAACGGSIPNLEAPECTAARQNVKNLFSYHFGNDMKPSPESLRMHEKYLTKNLVGKLKTAADTKFDYFTQTDDYPKAFRVGGCEAVSPEKTVFEVLLFWREGETSEQRAVAVESVLENGVWLVNNVAPKTGK